MTPLDIKPEYYTQTVQGMIGNTHVGTFAQPEGSACL